MLMWQIVIKMLAFLDRYFSRDASIKKPSHPNTRTSTQKHVISVYKWRDLSNHPNQPTEYIKFSWG